MAEINMVFVLPLEHKAKSDDQVDKEEAVATLILQPQQAVFDKPEENKYRHLKPLHMKDFVDGKLMTNMFVDGGAAVNLMPYTTFRKIGKSLGDLIKIDMMLKDFGGNAFQTRGH